ncbi:hypothetical protein O181_050143 [Austropuccinia psidii MF-1]|uniref:ATP-dependent RNA helicase n=1 Tax=Austropuccinia psidii MF-1 TaxID=1389203 RepID=A0A9Q3HM36_9BASI|nr:hypothetical protein [Austropuccinia psidii MF-1]
MLSFSRPSILRFSLNHARLSQRFISSTTAPCFLSQSSLDQLKKLHSSSAFSNHHAFSLSARDLNSTATARVMSNLDQNIEGDQQTTSAPKTKPFSEIQSYVSPALYRAITESPFGYSHMSSVQDRLLTDLPDLIQKPDDLESKTKDLMVKAKTGTGKTLAFLIPAIESRLRDLANEASQFKLHNPDASQQNFIQHMRRYEADTTGILVLSPTRELATQIAQEAVKLTSHIKQFGIRLFVGGASKSAQLREWERGRRDIVVATPGRMNDVLNSSRSVQHSLSKTKTLILDEADTLLEMGFKEEIDTIVEQLPSKDDRSTYLFSATISPEIAQIARQTMKANMKIIDCVPQGESNVHAHIPQHYTILPTPKDQIKHIFNLIAHDQLLNPTGKAIIFLPTTRMTELFSQLLSGLRRHMPWNSIGLTKVYEMHGGRSQAQREGIAKDFKAGRGGGYQILVTSDVSARGVDYPGVTRVIQVGIPTTRDIYVHRVGRTGRAGKSGRGDLVLLPFEGGYVSNTLRQIPIKPLTVSTLAEELKDLALKVDESNNPPIIEQTQQRSTNIGRNSRYQSRSNQMESSRSKHVQMALPVSPRLHEVDQNLQENLLPSIGEEPIRECFGSMLGYYVGKGPEMRVTRDVILDGLKQWAVDGMALQEEPYVSAAFLQKLGFSNNRQTSRMGGGARPFWQGRGGAQVRDNAFRSPGVGGGYSRYGRRNSGGDDHFENGKRDNFREPSYARQNDSYGRRGQTNGGWNKGGQNFGSRNGSGNSSWV